MTDSLIGVYKEVGQEPTLKKIKNSREELEQLVGGKIAILECEDYVIVYRDKSDSMLANVCLDIKGRGIGSSVKGTIFAVNQNDKGEFYSVTREQAGVIGRFFKAQGCNYTNFDEHGRYLTRAERKARAYEERKKKKMKSVNNVQAKNELDISNEVFENNFRLVPIVNKDENNPSDLNEDALKSINEKDTINESINNNNKGKLILESTQDSSTTSSSETNSAEVPNIVLGDDDTLKMLLKIQLIILEFLRKLVDENDE